MPKVAEVQITAHGDSGTRFVSTLRFEIDFYENKVNRMYIFPTYIVQCCHIIQNL